MNTGGDNFNVTYSVGHREIDIIETNSCAGGVASMPVQPGNTVDPRSFHLLMNIAFRLALDSVDPSIGGLAVIYDNIETHATGYAAAMADVTGEKVLLVEWINGDRNPPCKWEDGVLQVRDENTSESSFDCFLE